MPQEDACVKLKDENIQAIERATVFTPSKMKRPHEYRVAAETVESPFMWRKTQGGDDTGILGGGAGSTSSKAAAEMEDFLMQTGEVEPTSKDEEQFFLRKKEEMMRGIVNSASGKKGVPRVPL